MAWIEGGLGCFPSLIAVSASSSAMRIDSDKTGSKKAKVFPDPVGARRATSLWSRMRPMERAWIGVGAWMPREGRRA